jgi:alginate O-acetyltransferase complex protein AlgI
MLFNSPVFLYLFLPLFLLGYFIIPKQLRNVHVTLSSLVFFAWGSVPYTLLLLVSTAINYIFGILAGGKGKRLWMWLGILVNLAILFYYKYALFFIENYNLLATKWHIGAMNLPEIILPVGISFYTFHGMSYQIDVYRGAVKPQTNFFSLLLYKSFFPQLIAGPIIRYNQISKELEDRDLSFDNLTIGLKRFLIGLSKKILVANSFAYAADEMWGIYLTDMSTMNAWIGIIAYTFQIYIDFSAYSDMAIGLARMIGFHFPENFNFPYLASGFKDFWQRWHISLSSWFRDYLYIPMGGNRKGKWRTALNLWIVFLCTGFWHGASWNFLFWGFLHGAYLTVERLWKWNTTFIPRWIKIGVTFFLVMMAWVPFRAETMEQTWGFYQKLFGLGKVPMDNYHLYMQSNVLNNEFWLMLFVGVYFSFGFGDVKWGWNAIWQKAKNQWAVMNWLETIGLVFLFWICSVYIISGSYSPFIYFRF